MPTVMLIGANGQLGSDLQESLLYNNFELIALTHADLDICDEVMIKNIFNQADVDVVVNASAYTNVDKAEDDKENAYLINAYGPKILASYCAQHNLPLIHISTDYVFDTENGPHDENDMTCPKSVYGQTKLVGEQEILHEHQKAIILRTSWLFGRTGKNFVKTVLRLASEHNSLNVVNDQIGSPTPSKALAYDIAKICVQILDDSFHEYGIYHYAGFPYCSWADFAREIFKSARICGFLDHEVTVNNISSEEFHAKAPRPKDSRLDCKKINRIFNINSPKWADFLPETIKAYYDEI